MKTYKYIVFLLLACGALTPLAAIAQESVRDITLSEARELALEHNKDIAKSRLMLEQTRADSCAMAASGVNAPHASKRNIMYL